MQNTIFDTHCHYNLEPLYPNWLNYWEEARAQGVITAVVVGTDEDSSERACAISASDANLLAAVGIHPTEAAGRQDDITSTYLADMINQLQKTGPVAAIGETGLDYFRLEGSANDITEKKRKQIASLAAHLEIAEKLRLPALIHVRDKGESAYADVLTALKPFAENLTVVLHCFSGPEWYLDEALILGCYISFAGNVTYSSAENLRNHLRRVPVDRLLVETDAPYLPPQQHRGQTCQPGYISETVSYLQEQLNIDPKQLVNNARHIFTTMQDTGMKL
ncbi:TatD family hydrolase [Candidatus Woesebacteria bacterium]|nr:TatD family hydrolase [Candidatus Woesebacteria bacterium]